MDSIRNPGASASRQWAGFCTSAHALGVARGAYAPRKAFAHTAPSFGPVFLSVFAPADPVVGAIPAGLYGA